MTVQLADKMAILAPVVYDRPYAGDNGPIDYSQVIHAALAVLPDATDLMWSISHQLATALELPLSKLWREIERAKA